MTDIVYRLENPPFGTETSERNLMQAAADEIKRLRAASKWIPICDRPALDNQPGRQFVRLEGSREHSGETWARVYCGIAYTRPLGSEDEMLQYRKSDIVQMCKDGDMDEWSAVVTHWMPAIFPPVGP